MGQSNSSSFSAAMMVKGRKQSKFSRDVISITSTATGAKYTSPPSSIHRYTQCSGWEF